MRRQQARADWDWDVVSTVSRQEASKFSMHYHPGSRHKTVFVKLNRTAHWKAYFHCIYIKTQLDQFAKMKSWLMSLPCPAGEVCSSRERRAVKCSPEYPCADRVLWGWRYSDRTLDSVIMFSPILPKIQPIVIKWYICIYSGFLTHHALCFSVLFHMLCPVATWLPAVFSCSRFCPTQMALVHLLSVLSWSTSFPANVLLVSGCRPLTFVPAST